MAGRVPIPGVQRRDECGGELKVRAFEQIVCDREVVGESSLLLIEAIEPLGRHRRDQE